MGRWGRCGFVGANLGSHAHVTEKALVGRPESAPCSRPHSPGLAGPLAATLSLSSFRFSLVLALGLTRHAQGIQELGAQLGPEQGGRLVLMLHGWAQRAVLHIKGGPQVGQRAAHIHASSLHNMRMHSSCIRLAAGQEGMACRPIFPPAWPASRLTKFKTSGCCCNDRYKRLHLPYLC